LFNELLKLGSDVERCKLFVIDVDKSSYERIRAGINVDDCSDEPAGVQRISRKYKFDHISKSRTEDDG
jgi:hypothetical protein